MDQKENLSGWGNNINVNSNIYLPRNNADISNFYKKIEFSEEFATSIKYPIGVSDRSFWFKYPIYGSALYLVND